MSGTSPRELEDHLHRAVLVYGEDMEYTRQYSALQSPYLIQISAYVKGRWLQATLYHRDDSTDRLSIQLALIGSPGRTFIMPRQGLSLGIVAVESEREDRIDSELCPEIRCVLELSSASCPMLLMGPEWMASPCIFPGRVHQVLGGFLVPEVPWTILQSILPRPEEGPPYLSEVRWCRLARAASGVQIGAAVLRGGSLDRVWEVARKLASRASCSSAHRLYVQLGTSEPVESPSIHPFPARQEESPGFLGRRLDL